MKAIIAAGGSGTRLRPLTFSSNKHVLPIANKPLLLYAVESIAETGITEVGMIVNETRPAIEALIGDGSNWGLSVTYIPQEKPLGLAHVVKISREFINGDSFVYHLGDNIFTKGIMRPFQHFVDKSPNALLTIVEHDENFRMGVPFFDETGKLIKVVEKPENPPNKYGVPGLYFFDKHVFEAFEGVDAIQPSARGEYEITELYTYMINHGYTVDTELVDGTWMDPGKFVDMLKANQYVLDQKTAFHQEISPIDTSKIDENVDLGKNVRIVDSTITGPTVIGDNVTLDHAVIGPYVSLQDGVTIVDAVIKNSIVMSGTAIQHVRQPLIDSMIGRNSSIIEDSQDTTTLFIGDHCSIKLH